PKSISQVQLYSITGKLMNTVVASQNTERMNVVTSELPAGIYLLRIHTDDGVFGSRIVVQK
ncbi:MAG: T9SS C-terminal target domain-containing protein, partial [Bacteroidetes bacterium]